jgi:acyl carrier protein
LPWQNNWKLVYLKGEVIMERGEIQSKVRKVIAGVLKIAEEEVAADANFVFDLGADSMQSLEFVAAFEEEFEIELDEAAALEIQTVDGAVAFIAGALATQR